MDLKKARILRRMDSDQPKGEESAKGVWRPKPRGSDGRIISELKPEPIKFSAELLILKEVMDAKLKCQHYRNHKLEGGIWMIDRAMKSYHLSEAYHKPEWEECKTCNQ